MIFIDLENNPPGGDWIDRADALTQDLINAGSPAERKRIIDDNQSLWTELKAHLSGIRNRKCWYTESRNDGAHCHVDHFRPKLKALDESGADKGGYWWLAFDWMNYRFAGPAPNVKKKDYFPVLHNKANTYGDSTDLEDYLLLDPIVIDDPHHLAFDNEGRVIPKSTDINSRDYKRAFYSIGRYNLNLEGLKEARRKKYIKATNLIRQTQKLIALQTISFTLARQNEIIGKYKQLRDLGHPDAEYSATVKFCLESSGYDWARRIAMAA